MLWMLKFFPSPAETVVGHAVLREIVGADALAAVTGADLAAALARDGGVLLFLLGLIELGAQDLHGAVLVLVLAALVLTLHHKCRSADG